MEITYQGALADNFILTAEVVTRSPPPEGFTSLQTNEISFNGMREFEPYVLL